jgi:hypothetical protein
MSIETKILFKKIILYPNGEHPGFPVIVKGQKGDDFAISRYYPNDGYREMSFPYAMLKSFADSLVELIAEIEAFDNESRPN